MSLIDELGRHARQFLATHPIHVDDACNALKQGVHRFSLVQGPGRMVILQPNDDGSGQAIRGHWLPWAPKSATTMVLTPDQTHIFFTSEMSGCRFTYDDLGDGRVRVAHLAGNIEVPKPSGKGVYSGGFGRDRAEGALFEPGHLLRKLSYTQYGPNWAFVVGNYTAAERAWKFVAQINQGDGVAQAAEFVNALII